MNHPFSPDRKCIFYRKNKKSKGVILKEYEELGGPEDGQEYIIVKEIKTKRILHVKKEDVLEIIN